MPGGWECLARHEGGTVVALTTAPLSDGTTAFFAATTTGLFRSDDGGRQWRPTGETPLPLLTAVAPSARFAENRLLFAGSRTGVYRSTDAGRTWRQTLSGGIFTVAVVVPGSGPEDRLFVGTERDGILHSGDGGRTWAGVNPGLLDLTVLALAFSPDAAHDLTGFAATASGLYHTRNGGKSWREAALPLDEPVMQCLAVSPAFARDRLVLAGTETDGLWRSDNGGTAWYRVPRLPEGGIGAIAFSPGGGAGRHVAVATDGGVALSDDGGETWEMTGQSLPPALALAWGMGSDGETLIVGRYRQGIARLQTGKRGAGWIPSNTGLEATHLTTLVASPTFDHDPTLFAVGPETGLRRSRDGGYTWAEATGNIGGAIIIHGLAVSPDGAGNLIVAVTDAGISRSRDGGMTWEASADGSDAPAEIVAGGMPAAGKPPFILAATLDGHLIASNDGGAQWRPLSVPFTGETILSLACSPHNARGHALYVGTAVQGGHTVRLWRSNDGGENWTRWLEERGGGTLPLAVAPDGSPFVGIGGWVLHPRRSAWQRREGVRSPVWNVAALVDADGSPAAITALAVSPYYHTDGMVFAATGVGMYRSRDRGDTFAPWSEDLATKPILAVLATTVADGVRDAPGQAVFALGVNGTIWRRAGDA